MAKNEEVGEGVRGGVGVRGGEEGGGGAGSSRGSSSGGCGREGGPKERGPQLVDHVTGLHAMAGVDEQREEEAVQ